MKIVKKYPDGVFSWTDLTTTDIAGAVHHVLGVPEPEPVILVPVVDEDGEREPERDPHGRPAERLADPHHVRLAMEHPQVEGEHQQNESDEAYVDERQSRVLSFQY